MNGIKRADVGVHLLLGDLVQFLFLAQSPQFLLEGVEPGVLLVEVIGQGLTVPSPGVFQLISQQQLFLPNFGEHEQHFFQGNVEQACCVGVRFNALFELQQVEVVAGFAIELVEFLKIKLVEERVFPSQANKVEEATSIGQGFFQGQHGGAILDLADLPRKFLGVFDIKAEHNILDLLNFTLDLLGGFEQSFSMK